MSTALSIVQKFYPQVRAVKDAKDHLSFTVSEKEAQALRKNHQKCAVAEACKREYDVDGVIISRRTAYLVKGRQAVRYNIPGRTALEIAAFDRGGDFQPGEYQLQTPRIKEPSPGTRVATNAKPGSLKSHRRDYPGLREALYKK